MPSAGETGKEEEKSQKVETNYRRENYADDTSTSSQEAERENIDVDVEEYFKTHLLKEDASATEAGDKKPWKDRFKQRANRKLMIFLAIFSKKLFFRHSSLITTFVEVFVSPLMILGIFAAFTHGISWDKAYQEKKMYEEKLRFPETEMEDAKQNFRNRYCDAGGGIFLLFYPNTTLTRSILAEVIDEFDIEEHNRFRSSKEFNCNNDEPFCSEPIGLIACESPQEILELALLHRKDRRKHKEPIGIVFDYDEQKTDNETEPIIPKTLKYRIQLFSKEISQTSQLFPYVEPPRTKTKESPYVTHGFFGLQYAVEEAYLEIVDDMIRKQLLHSSNTSRQNLLGRGVTSGRQILNDPSFKFIEKYDIQAWPLRIFKMYHYPNFINNTLKELIISVVSVTMLASYSFFTFFIVKQIVTENNSEIKVLLQLHHLPLYMHWVTLGLHAGLLRLITGALITWFLYQDYGNGAIISRSDPLLVSAFITIHLWCYSSFIYYLSTNFNGRALLSGMYAVFIGYLTFIIPTILKMVGLMTDWPNLVATIFLPHWAFINGMKQIIALECEEKGLTFGNGFLPPGDSRLSFLVILAILSGSGTFYFSLAVFLDVTKQRALSHTHKWYQCKKARQEKTLQKQDHEEMMQDLKENAADDAFQKPDVYEEEDRTSIVHLRHITTTGGKHKVILDNVNLNFYHGEISILLGHTGSGKSSLIHVMGGMLVPSHGYVTIKGYDVNYDRKKAREYIGYCPQKVILYNLLSVMEHLTLCYRLRGVSNSEAKKHAFGLLTLMRLWDLRKKTPSELNETNKRKLSISLALVNAPQVLLLDEPTRGLDSIARREIWGILVELRRHHTIVIGTNRMDEAEYLGDRIALLSHGRLICFGTPKYLKSHYDTGYFLKIFPSKTAEKPFDYEKTVQIIEKHMDEKPKEEQPDEILETAGITFELRRTKMARYPDLFDELDQEMENLGIDEYSVAQISLYDVFIKICDAVSLDNEAPDKCFRRGFPDERRKTFDEVELPSILKHEEFKQTKGNSARALVKKRMIAMRSKNKLFVSEYVIPLIIIMAVCYHVNLFVQPINDPKDLELSLRTFSDAEVFYRVGPTDLPTVMNRNYRNNINRTLRSNGLKLLKTEQVITKFEESSSYKDGYAREKHFIGVEFRQFEMEIEKLSHVKKQLEKFVQFAGYYSSDALHGPPVVMNLISNIILDTLFPRETGVDREIVVVNDPFPEQILSDVEITCDITCMLFASILSFALSLFVAGIIVFPKIERITGMKHIQLMTGLHPLIYWGTEYLCDLIVTAFYSIFVIAIFTVSSLALIKPLAIWDVISIALIIVLYLCWSAVPFAYFLSSVSPNKVSGYGFYVILHLFLGVMPRLVVNVKDASNAVIFLRNFMNIFPMYTITAALHQWFEINVASNKCYTMPESVKAICEKISKYDKFDSRQSLYDFIIQEDYDFAKCCDMVCKSRNRNKCFDPPFYFDWKRESFEDPQLLQFCAFFVLQGFFYWGLLILIDRGVVTNMFHKAVLKFIQSHSKTTARSRPPDVQAEWEKCEEIIESKSFPEDVALVCQDLTKSLSTVMLINDVCIAIKKGECIGVLGGGGSGKSTLIKLLCGEALATTGEVFIGDSSIHHHRVEFLSKIGYCPQNFCLFERFTATQMLELMGRLRGIPKAELNQHVDQWLNIFGLYEAKNDMCKHLTYGMRRSVCAAMCLIGGSEIILMDEPTSGIDPSCRQRFWTIMKLLTTNGRTVVFTSYNTEECSYLSSRMIVMCEGNVQCLGPPRELIQRFSRGFTILIRIRHEILSPMEIMSTTMGRVVALKKTMKKKFKHLTLRDEQDNLLLYFLRDLGFKWGELFRRMSQVLDENYEIIEKYYISESTIDEIFILLTNKYREMDAPRKMEPKSAGSITQKQAEKKALKAAKNRVLHDKKA